MKTNLEFRTLLVLTLMWSGLSNAQWTRASGPNAGTIHCFLALGQRLFAGADSCLLVSTDRGANWTAASRNITSISCLGSMGNYLYAGTSSLNWYSIGVYRSSDGGASWYGPNLYGYVSSFGVIDTMLFTAGIQSIIDNPKGFIMASSDSGASWSSLADSGLSNIFPMGPLAVNGTTLFVVANGGGAFRSGDYGASWIPAYIGSVTTYVHGFAFVGAEILAATSDGVFRSQDGGNSWTASDSGLSSVSVIDLTADTRYVFGCTQRGTFFSADTGKKWREVSSGLPDSGITSIVLEDSIVCVGTAGNGIWRRPLSEMLTAVKDHPIQAPLHFALAQNYPNPFNPATRISYELPTDALVVLRVFDVLGREVEILVNEREPAGSHSVEFNGSALPSGVYFYRLEAGTYHDTKKLLLLK